MSKFESIYQQVVQKQKLRDEIPSIEVNNLPISVREDIEAEKKNKELLQRLRKSDNSQALERLNMITRQLGMKKVCDK